MSFSKSSRETQDLSKIPTKTLFLNEETINEDNIFPVYWRFVDCKNPNKVGLAIGIYRDQNGQSYVLDVVKKCEREIANEQHSNKDYLKMSGLDSFVTGALKLLFGSDCDDIRTGLIQGVQSISGTGAYRLACELVNKHHNVDNFYCPDPTWPIHRSVLQLLGVKSTILYKYYNTTKSELCGDDILSTLNSAPPRSAVVLQGPGHNPTGVDFTHDQWKVIANILIKRELIPILDIAYLGFVSGSIEVDSYPARLLHSLGKEMLVCVSFSKNMGLYNERAGILGWYSPDKEVSDRLKDRLCYIIRNSYSTPPAHGAKLASAIMNNESLFEEWKVELKSMSDRVKKMRHALFERLSFNKTPGDWSLILTQQGLFSYTGLHKPQIKYLEDNFSIFMLETGRINISALTEHNVNYVADAIHEAVINIKDL